MLILRKHFKTKINKIGPIERMLHCVKIEKLKKMTLYLLNYDLQIISISATYKFIFHRIVSTAPSENVFSLSTSNVSMNDELPGTVSV